MTAKAEKKNVTPTLAYMSIALLVLLLALASMAQIPTSPATSSEQQLASGSKPHSPPVSTGQDLGASEAEAIAIYYSRGKDMPIQEVDGIGPVIGWKDHVVERHGNSTWEALWEELGKGDWNRHDCDDGRTYLTKRQPGHEDRWWFVVIGSKVIDSARLVVTGYSGDRGAVLAPLDRDDCKPPRNLGHDFAGG